MKHQIIRTLKSFIALIAAATLGACTNDDIIIEKPQPSDAQQTYTLTITAGKGGDAQTRALGGGDASAITATWAAGDVVTVYNTTTSTDLGGTLIAQSDGATTTLTGSLTGSISSSDVLTLKFLSADYANQDGTLDYIAAHCDYATANVTVNTVDGSNNITISETSADFINQQSIFKFTLTDGSNAVTASKFIKDKNAATDPEVSVTLATPVSTFYVAMPVSSTNDFTIYDQNGKLYSVSKSGSTLINGKYYTSTLTVAPDPLTLKALEYGSTLSIKNLGDHTKFSYSINDGPLQNAEGTNISIFLEKNDIVKLYGHDGAIKADKDNHTSICCVLHDFEVYGNVMSLISTDYNTATTISNAYQFVELFHNSWNYNGTKLKNHATKKLILPATTLTQKCYYRMFLDCDGLTAAPDLSATTLAEDCYSSMFQGCTNLITPPAMSATTLANSCCNRMFSDCSSLAAAPSLPAETMKKDCYNFMFLGCTSLTTPPVLPATTLAEGCYSGMFYGCSGLTTAPTLSVSTLEESCYAYMFYGCTNLTTAPALPAETMKDCCYMSMFEGCTGLTTAPTLPATSLAPACYMSMFEGCTSLTTAPTLPAPTMENQCYQGMFKNCSNLNNVKCFATTDYSGATLNWLDGVATSGTFTKHPSSTFWSEGSTSGIPSGWTVLPLPVGALPGQFSVSASKKVYFSKGNLQLTAANTWMFADNQYDYFGGSQSDNHRDLFGWGTGNNPNQTSDSNGDYSTFTEWGNNSDLQSSFGTGWRTLTKDEWTYLFNNRSTTSGVRYAKATVNGKSGVILLPDDWSTSYYDLASTNTYNAAFTSNSISSSVWSGNFAAHGCVFLPAAGYRYNSSVNDVGSYGYYWSSSLKDSYMAYRVLFDSGSLDTAGSSQRYRGCSVRLVCDVPTP